MLEEIRKRLREIPFLPFFVRLVDSRTIQVPHPDFVWLPAPGALHIWVEEDKASEHINPLLILSVESHFEKPL